MHVIETILWKSIPWAGHESARLLPLDDGWQLEGAAAFLNDGQPCRLVYTITCDRDWHTRRATVNGWAGEREVDIVIEAVNGVWMMNGVEQKQVAGCIDVDLACTPLTNTLPIRRLGKVLDRRQEIRVAFVAFPALSVRAVSQAYTRLGPGRYRFDSPEHAFTADIGTDDEGLVLDYPGLFYRHGA